MKFLTNAAQQAAKDFVLKYKPVYTGLLLAKQLPGKLAVKPVDGLHVTTCFRPSNEQWLECAMGSTQGYIRPMGYANNGVNEGISVAIKGYNFYAGAKVAHVTLSCSPIGKPVDTAYLPFKPIDDGSKGWKQRLAEGTTVKWAFSRNAALEVEATAFYGGGKSLSIKSIQEECKAYIAEHCPEEAEAAEALAKLQTAKAIKRQKEEELQSATYKFNDEVRRYNELMAELNKPRLVREAEAKFEELMDVNYCAPDDEFIITNYTDTIVHFKWTNYNGTPYATGTYTHEEGVKYDE